MGTTVSGHLAKMRSTIGEGGAEVEYRLPLDDQELTLNSLIGQNLRLRFDGLIHCCNCGRKTNKSFNQGYCYPCFKKLAQCDTCIVSPEKCHFDQGTCREPDWAASHCHVPHIVYLANSSGLKVGITRQTQIPTRWIDQGATQALPIMRVATRLQSGLVEDAFRAHVKDKTNWRAMLKGEAEEQDMSTARDRLFEQCAAQLDELFTRFGQQDLQFIDAETSTKIVYPVLEYPTKVASHNADKTPEVSGRLMGIKGQYLMLDSGVINIRKYTAYHITLEY